MEFDEYRVLSKAASGGGYFVPTDLADHGRPGARFLPGGVGTLARTVVTSSGETINVPLNLTHGTAAWIAESASYTPVGRDDHERHPVGLQGRHEDHRLRGAPDRLARSIWRRSSRTEFGERIGALAETAYITGDGSGKPTGITNGATVTRVTLAAGQVATTTYAGLAPAIWAVPAQYRDEHSPARLRLASTSSC